jgi:flagellar motility protein MotE (MotC chaperone)
MEAIDERSVDREERQGELSQKPGRKKPKKKKRAVGCALLSLFIIMLACGAIFGLRLLGIVDIRSITYKAGSHLPFLGDRLFPPGEVVITPEERRIQELQEYEKQINSKFLELQRKEEELEKKERELTLMEEELQARARSLAEMTQTPSSLELQVEEELFPKVIAIIQEMSTRRAAEVLNDFTDSLAVEVLKALPPDTAGAILGRMDAAKAARLMEQMATEKGE